MQFETRPRKLQEIKKKTQFTKLQHYKAVVVFFYLFTSSYLLHCIMYDVTGVLCIPATYSPLHYAVIAASSINKTVAYSSSAGSHQDSSQSHGNSTSQGTAQQILHMERMREQKRETVCHSVFFFLFSSSAHATECATCCGATIAVWEWKRMDGSEASLWLGVLCL